MRRAFLWTTNEHETSRMLVDRYNKNSKKESSVIQQIIDNGFKKSNARLMPKEEHGG